MAMLIGGAALTPTLGAHARPELTVLPAQALPPPQFGRTLDVGLVSGTVVITPPSQRPFKLGVQDRNIPIGSLIDTTRGRIDLRAAPPPTAAAARDARVEDAEFYDGAFKVRQAPGALITGVRLAGGNFRLCLTSSASPRAQAASLPHRVVRLLGASGRGQFRTRGRYAAATVRGTVWLTEDFCDGTLVRVKRGVVSVDDFVRHTSVTLGAGKSYFARAG